MSVPTPPHKMTCIHCGWSTYRPGHGDVIPPADRQLPIECCPKCGSRDLGMRRLSLVEQALFTLMIEVGELLRRGAR